MAMLGREVMMPAALIARPPEEPYATSVPFVCNLRDTLATPIVEFGMRLSHRRERRNRITTNMLVLCHSM